MDSFVEKFNVFDLFTMLIPGIIISTLFGISLSFRYYSLWLKLGNEKYIVFLYLAIYVALFFKSLALWLIINFFIKFYMVENQKKYFYYTTSTKFFLTMNYLIKKHLKLKIIL
ncbi:MAG: hypothetical protein K1W19_08000 [Lachnospiraceae bacterium]